MKFPQNFFIILLLQCGWRFVRCAKLFFSKFRFIRLLHILAKEGGSGMTPFEVTMLITLLANVMAEDLDDAQLNYISIVFQQLADTLATIALQRSTGQSAESSEGDGEDHLPL